MTDDDNEKPLSPPSDGMTAGEKVAAGAAAVVLSPFQVASLLLVVAVIVNHV